MASGDVLFQPEEECWEVYAASGAAAPESSVDFLASSWTPVSPTDSLYLQWHVGPTPCLCERSSRHQLTTHHHPLPPPLPPPPTSPTNRRNCNATAAKKLRRLCPRMPFLSVAAEAVGDSWVLLSHGPDSPGALPAPPARDVVAACWVAQMGGRQTVELVPKKTCANQCQTLLASLEAGDLRRFWKKGSGFASCQTCFDLLHARSLSRSVLSKPAVQGQQHGQRHVCGHGVGIRLGSRAQAGRAAAGHCGG